MRRADCGKANGPDTIDVDVDEGPHVEQVGLTTAGFADLLRADDRIPEADLTAAVQTAVRP